MTDQFGNHEPLLRGVRTRRQRRMNEQLEGKRTLFEQLAVVGSLGWLIVTPALLGVVLGRWIDGHFGSGIQATAGALVAGAALGFWLAWRRMHTP